ncbi:MAG: hypothetical protein RJA58_917, partial [Pseudomonadota bacterium]
ALEIVPVKWIDQVLDLALSRAPVPLPEEDESIAPVASESGDSNAMKKTVPPDALPH